MATPQQSIFTPLAPYHRHLEYNFTGEPNIVAARALVELANVNQGIVLGFGHSAWLSLGQQAPEQLKPFTDIGSARSTQADVWVWLSGEQHSELLDLGMKVHQLLDGIAKLEREVEGHEYHQSRDLTGFEDGSANPKTDEARRHAGCIQTDLTGAGGSYVLTQQWKHNLSAFHASDVKEQEAVIGRTKADSIELEGDDMPATSHVSRTDVKVDNVPQKVWRRSIPWGGVEQNGLYFVGFACELSRLEIQLERMFGLSGDGLKDRLTEFSTPLSSSWFFAPSIEQLQAL